MRAWLIHDSRAHIDPDRALVYDTLMERYGWTLDLVREERDLNFPGGTILEYDVVGRALTNRREVT